MVGALTYGFFAKIADAVERDPRKAAANLKKHASISPKQRSFCTTNARSGFDLKTAEEERHVTIGLDALRVSWSSCTRGAEIGRD
jgi:hypothetical protein